MTVRKISPYGYSLMVRKISHCVFIQSPAPVSLPPGLINSQRFLNYLWKERTWQLNDMRVFPGEGKPIALCFSRDNAIEGLAIKRKHISRTNSQRRKDYVKRWGKSMIPSLFSFLS